jgi:glycosyltransferase involved in cell wall biosynthesis
MPKVSIILPNYNHAPYLERRVQSILNQTYQDFELIYLDDASTDNSNEVFAKYADDPRVQMILNQINSGSPFKQWNKGIRQASGDYIWIAESDDYAYETLLEQLVAKLDQHPTVGIAYCQSWQINENGLLKSTLNFHTDSLDRNRWEHDFLNSGKDECGSYLICKNTIPNASGVVFRRALYEKVGRADETMLLCGDWLLWVKILLHSDIAFVSEPLNYFREHSNTSRAKLTKLGYELHESLEIVRIISYDASPSQADLVKGIDEAFNRWARCLFSGDSSLQADLLTCQKLIKIEGSLPFKLYLYRKIATMMVTSLSFRLKWKTRLKSFFRFTG